jgi:hypothetical protein
MQTDGYLCKRCKKVFNAARDQTKPICPNCYAVNTVSGDNDDEDYQLLISERRSKVNSKPANQKNEDTHYKKLTHTIKLILKIFFGSIVFAFSLIAIFADNKNTNENTVSKVETKRTIQVISDEKRWIQLLDEDFFNKIPKDLEWLRQVSMNCTNYKNAKNEIQKSNIFNANREYINGIKLIDLEVYIDDISTVKGGRSADLKLKRSDSDLILIKVNIKYNEKIYEEVSDFSIGECARVTGEVREAASFYEKSEVCYPHFQVAIASLQKCEVK